MTKSNYIRPKDKILKNRLKNKSGMQFEINEIRQHIFYLQDYKLNILLCRRFNIEKIMQFNFSTWELLTQKII